MRYCYIALLCLGLVGCAGKAKIWEYEAVDGRLELKKMTEFEGKNIKCNTEKGAGLETKNLEFPSVPVFR